MMSRMTPSTRIRTRWHIRSNRKMRTSKSTYRAQCQPIRRIRIVPYLPSCPYLNQRRDHWAMFLSKSHSNRRSRTYRTALPPNPSLFNPRATKTNSLTFRLARRCQTCCHWSQELAKLLVASPRGLMWVKCAPMPMFHKCLSKGMPRLMSNLARNCLTKINMILRRGPIPKETSWSKTRNKPISFWRKTSHHRQERWTINCRKML